MRRLTFIFLFSLTTFFSLGQKAHLEPAQDLKQFGGDLKSYFDSIFSKLYKGFSLTPYARYTSMPSFSYEYAFSAEIINGKYYILSNRLSQNYWYFGNRNTVELISKKVEITNMLYSKIGELFQILASQIKKSEKEVMGLDGVTYYFATVVKNGEVKAGETWSPDDNSLLGVLVKICDKLFVMGNGISISQIDIVKEIEKLITDLK